MAIFTHITGDTEILIYLVAYGDPREWSVNEVYGSQRDSLSFILSIR